MAKKDMEMGTEEVVMSAPVKQYKSVKNSTIYCPMGKIGYGDIFTAKEEDIKDLLEKKYIVEVKTKSMSM